MNQPYLITTDGTIVRLGGEKPTTCEGCYFYKEVGGLSLGKCTIDKKILANEQNLLCITRGGRWEEVNNET